VGVPENPRRRLKEEGDFNPSPGARIPRRRRKIALGANREAATAV
jgi:exonuclease VII large subunit